jgi:hypothetical protein
MIFKSRICYFSIHIQKSVHSWWPQVSTCDIASSSKVLQNVRNFCKSGIVLTQKAYSAQMSEPLYLQFKSKKTRQPFQIGFISKFISKLVCKSLTFFSKECNIVLVLQQKLYPVCITLRGVVPLAI